MIDYKYAYLIGSVTLLSLWLFMFITGKSFRKEMMLLSLATLVLAPTQILYIKEYWYPDVLVRFWGIDIESFIVCFAYGGVCGVLYEYVFRKTSYRVKSINLQISKIQFFVGIMMGIMVTLFLEVFTSLNIIYTTSSGLLFASIVFIFFRSDLLIPSLFNAFATVVVSVLIYWILLFLFPEFFDRFWIPDTISNIRFLLIPIEEYYFHFALGACVGVMYEVGYAENDG